MCKGLREKYPEDCSPDELIEKYFPDVVAIKKAPPKTSSVGNANGSATRRIDGE